MSQGGSGGNDERIARVVLEADTSKYTDQIKAASKETQTFEKRQAAYNAALGETEKKHKSLLMTIGKRAAIFTAADIAIMSGMVTVAAQLERQLSTLSATTKTLSTSFREMPDGQIEAQPSRVGSTWERRGIGAGAVNALEGAQQRIADSTPQTDLPGLKQGIGLASGVAQGVVGAPARAIEGFLTTDPATDAVRKLQYELPTSRGHIASMMTGMTRMALPDSERTPEGVADYVRQGFKFGSAQGADPMALMGQQVEFQRSMGTLDHGLRGTQRASDATQQASVAAGVGAQDILSFGQEIGPSMRAAGMTEPQAIGMSAAMARTGQDSRVGRMVINNMANEIAHMQRYNDPGIIKFAAPLGLSRDEAQQMDPYELMSGVLGQAKGPEGIQTLRNLGIDSPRMQQSVQALANEDIDQFVTEATGAYQDAPGNQVDSASAEAMNGVFDNMERLRNVFTDMAQAIGATLLPAVESITDALADFAEMLKPIIDLMGKVGGMVGGVLAPVAGAATAVGAPLGAAALAVGAYSGLAKKMGDSSYAKSWRAGRDTARGTASPAQQQLYGNRENMHGGARRFANWGHSYGERTPGGKGGGLGGAARGVLNKGRVLAYEAGDLAARGTRWVASGAEDMYGDSGKTGAQRTQPYVSKDEYRNATRGMSGAQRQDYLTSHRVRPQDMRFTDRVRYAAAAGRQTYADVAKRGPSAFVGNDRGGKGGAADGAEAQASGKASAADTAEAQASQKNAAATAAESESKKRGTGVMGRLTAAFDKAKASAVELSTALTNAAKSAAARTKKMLTDDTGSVGMATKSGPVPPGMRQTSSGLIVDEGVSNKRTAEQTEKMSKANKEAAAASKSSAAASAKQAEASTASAKADATEAQASAESTRTEQTKIQKMRESVAAYHAQAKETVASGGALKSLAMSALNAAKAIGTMTMSQAATGMGAMAGGARWGVGKAAGGLKSGLGSLAGMAGMSNPWVAGTAATLGIGYAAWSSGNNDENWKKQGGVDVDAGLTRNTVRELAGLDAEALVANKFENAEQPLTTKDLLTDPQAVRANQNLDKDSPLYDRLIADDPTSHTQLGLSFLKGLENSNGQIDPQVLTQALGALGQVYGPATAEQIQEQYAQESENGENNTSTTLDELGRMRREMDQSGIQFGSSIPTAWGPQGALVGHLMPRDWRETSYENYAKEDQNQGLIADASAGALEMARERRGNQVANDEGQQERLVRASNNEQVQEMWRETLEDSGLRQDGNGDWVTHGSRLGQWADALGLGQFGKAGRAGDEAGKLQAQVAAMAEGMGLDEEQRRVLQDADWAELFRDGKVTQDEINSVLDEAGIYTDESTKDVKDEIEKTGGWDAFSESFQSVGKGMSELVDAMGGNTDAVERNTAANKEQDTGSTGDAAKAEDWYEAAAELSQNEAYQQALTDTSGASVEGGVQAALEAAAQAGGGTGEQIEFLRSVRDDLAEADRAPIMIALERLQGGRERELSSLNLLGQFTDHNSPDSKPWNTQSETYAQDMAAWESKGKDMINALYNKKREYDRMVETSEESMGVARQRGDREFNKARERNEIQRDRRLAYEQEDYARNRGYQHEDFARNKQRADYQFNKGRDRSQEDFSRERQWGRYQFEKSMGRAEGDYAESRERNIGLYEKNVGRTEEDFALSRERARADFAKQRGRSTKSYARQQEWGEADFMQSLERQEKAHLRSRQWQQDDFQKQRQRSLKSFHKSVDRANADFQKGWDRQEKDFHKQRSRTFKDFAKQDMRTREDYNRQIGRQTQDFYRNLERQAKDAAKAIYNPYQRVMSKPTVNANSLMEQLRDQNERLRAQKQQVEELMSRGLSQDAVDVLGLADAQNAQQVDRLTRTGSDTELEELNRLVVERLENSTDLVQDDINETYRRTIEDFERMIERSNEDFARSLERRDEDFAESLARQDEDWAESRERQLEDFAQSMSRQAEDFAESLAYSVEDFAQSMERSQLLYEEGVQYAREDFAKQMERSKLLFDEQMTYSLEDFDESMQRSADDFAKSMARQNEDFLENLAWSDAQFRKQMDRAREDFNEQMAKSLEDFARQMDRAMSDYLEQAAWAWEDFSRQLARYDNERSIQLAREVLQHREAMQWMADDHRQAYRDMEEDHKRMLTNWWKDLVWFMDSTTKTMAEKSAVVENWLASEARRIGGQVGSYMIELQKQVAKTAASVEQSVSKMAKKTADLGLDAKGKLEKMKGMFDSLPGVVSKVLGSVASVIKSFIGGGLAQQISSALGGILQQIKNAIGGILGGLGGAAGGIGGTIGGIIGGLGRWVNPFMATGGIVTAPTKATIGEGGVPELVLPLNERGSQFLQQALGGRQMGVTPTIERSKPVGDYDGTRNTNRMSQPQVVYVRESNSNDVNVNGAITVVSQDPDQMARALAHKARMRSLQGFRQ